VKLQNLVTALEESGLNVSMYAYKGCVWMDDGNELTVNTDANVEDLRNGEGDTYSFEYRHYEQSEDGFFVYHDADNHQGYKDTIILRCDEQVTVEDEE